MKRAFFLLFIICNGISCQFKAAMDCPETIMKIEQFINDSYEPDSISVAIKTWTDGIYSMPNSIVIEIYNPTTQLLDYKVLPLDDYQKIGNIEEIMGYLEDEGYLIANLLTENCDLSSNVNDIIVIFLKIDKNNIPRYQIVCSYPDLL